MCSATLACSILSLPQQARLSHNFGVPILPLFGHDLLRERLVKAAERDALPASILLHGPARVGKQRLALWLGQYLLCEEPEKPCGVCRSCRFARELGHPDLHWFFPRPSAGSMTASQALEDLEAGIRERQASGGLYPPPSGAEGIRLAYVQGLLSRAALSPAISRRKVFVIGEAQQMVQGNTEDAANAFLKLLEEPPANTTIILTSSEPGAMLPTILSRVVQIRVPRLSEQAVREFLSYDLVGAELKRQGLQQDEPTLLRLADGAPGALIGAEASDDAVNAAKVLLAAIDGSRAMKLRAAWVQGAAGARGAFSDTLDELTAALRDQARAASERRDETAAYRYSAAVARVEQAKEHATGNVNPQLITASLLRDLASTAR